MIRSVPSDHERNAETLLLAIVTASTYIRTKKETKQSVVESCLCGATYHRRLHKREWGQPEGQSQVTNYLSQFAVAWCLQHRACLWPRSLSWLALLACHQLPQAATREGWTRLQSQTSQEFKSPERCTSCRKYGQAPKRRSRRRHNH